MASSKDRAVGSWVTPCITVDDIRNASGNASPGLARKIDPLNWPLPPPLSDNDPWPTISISPSKLELPVMFSVPVTTRTPAPLALPKLKSPFT